MRIFTRTTKVLRLAPSEFAALQDMLREVSSKGSAERAMNDTEILCIEVREARPPRVPHDSGRT